MHVGQQRLRLLLNLLFPTRQFSNETIQKICKNCKTCIERQRLCAANAIGNAMIPSRPNEIISIDHFTPFGNVVSLHNKSTIMTIKDHFTKLITLVPCRGYGHQEIVDALRVYFSMNGVPSMIRLDNALVSDSMKNFFTKLNVKMNPTPVQRPQANGQVERIHRDLRKIFNELLTSLKVPINRWVEIVPVAANIVNSTPHWVTKFAPSELHFGRLTTDLGTINDKKLKEKYKIVKERLLKQQKQQNRPAKGPFPTVLLQPGDPVWAYLTGEEPVKAKIIKDFGDFPRI